MKLDDAIDYFGTQAEIARTLGITEAAVSKWWEKKNGIVPMKNALKLKRLTHGELDLRLKDYE